MSFQLCPEPRGRLLCDRDESSPARTDVELSQHVAALRALLGSEPVVAVACRDRYQLLASCLSVWASGGVAVLGATEPAALLEVAARQCGAVTLLTDRADAERLEARSEPRVFQRVLRVDRVEPDAGVAQAPFAVAPEQSIVTMFTSGTTGQSQRVDKRARQLFGEALVLAERFGLGEGSVIAATVPGHHVYGLLFSLLVPYLGGARLVPVTPFQPREIALVVRRFGVTDLVTVPAHLAALRHAQLEQGSLGRVFSSGAVLDPALARDVAARFGVRVVDVLGSTESGGIAWREPALEERYQPLPGVEVDTEEGGTLRLRSPFLEEPAAWTTHADRVRLVPGGFFHEGRADGVVKVAGKRVAAQELEARARELAGVTDAAVVIAPSTRAREQEPWLLLASEDATWTLERLRRELGRHFDAAVLPRRLRVLARLPRNAVGKLEREVALRAFADPESVEHRASFEVPLDWKFFQGHFPGEPIAPAVAQLTSIVLREIRRVWPELRDVAELERVKFKRPITPGEALSVRLFRRNERCVRFELGSGDELASVGVLSFAE